MDALIYMIFALVIVIKVVNTTNVEEATKLTESSKDMQNRVAKINESYYEDLDAFSEIIHALGFPKE